MNPNRYATITDQAGRPVAVIALDRSRLLPIVAGSDGDDAPPAPPTPPGPTITQADITSAANAASAQARAEAYKALGFDSAEDAQAAVTAWKDHQTAQLSAAEAAEARAAEAEARATAAESRAASIERATAIEKAIGDHRFATNVEAALAGKDLTAENLDAAVATVRAQFPEAFPVDPDGNPITAPAAVAPPKPAGIGGTAPKAGNPPPKAKDRLSRGAETWAARHPQAKTA